MKPTPEPVHVSQAISELIALRGYARKRGDAQLQDVWQTIAGPKFAEQTRVAGINRGILQVNVGNSSLLAELASFHKPSLLRTLKEQHPELRIKDLKFRIDTNISNRLN